jgi:molecular chaperone HscB
MTETLQICRSCGSRAAADAHFCSACSKILSLSGHDDYFSFLGLPRQLAIDQGDLERRFHALSRQFHPDYFYNATSAERRASLERSSYLNDAYRMLKNPITRVEYLLRLEGFSVKNAEEAGKLVPAALLEEVFALNEELDDIRGLRAGGAATDEWKPRLERAGGPIEAKRAAHERHMEELSAEWDRLTSAGAPVSKRRPVLEALRDRLLERHYINNLLAGIQREREL